MVCREKIAIWQNRKFLIGSIIFLFLTMAVGWILYVSFGHKLIEAMYEGRSIEFLNRVIIGQATYPVEYYFEKADKLFFNFVSANFLAMIGILIYKLKHFFSNNCFYWASLFYALLICVPWAPSFAYFGLENSWGIALHYFFRSGFQYGKDIIWSFGPYGFIYTRQYFPATFFITLLLYSFLTYVYVKVIWDFVKATGLSAFRALATIFIVFSVLCYGQNHLYFDAFFYMGPALLLLQYFLFPRDSLNVYLLVITLACVSLVKISFVPPIFFIVTIASVDSIFYRRKFPWFLLVFLFAFLTLWLQAGQSVGDLRCFFFNSLEIMRPFSETMVAESHGFKILELLVYCSLAILLPIYFLRVISIKTFSGILFLGGLSCLLFVVFKSSFVRHDYHSVMGMTFLPAFSILSFLALPLNEDKKTHILKGLLIIFSILNLLIMCNFSFVKDFGGLGAMKNSFNGIAQLILDKDSYKKRYASIVRENKLDVQGAVDIYPFDQGRVVVSGLKYNPRPIMQSYSAYSARLAKANADYLKGPEAPEHILFRLETIDVRFPAMDDGASWPEIWSRYNLQDKLGEHLVFKRSETPKNYSLIPVGILRAKFGEEIFVPAQTNGLLWAKISIPKNLIGKIMSVLFKIYPPDIHLKLRVGNAGPFRLLPTVSEGGFLLSPLITDNKAFAAVAATLRGGDVNTVVSFKILPFRSKPLCRWFFDDDIRIAFYKLEFGKEE